MTRSMLIVLAAIAALATAGAAYAQTSNVFGNGGVTYTFTTTCSRVTVLPPGISDHESLNVLAQQVSCLAKREKRIRNCYRNATLVFLNDHPNKPGHPGDWGGVDQLKKCGSK